MRIVRYQVQTSRGPYDGDFGPEIISRSYWSTEQEAEGEAQHRRTENNKMGRTYAVIREEFDIPNSHIVTEQHS